MMGKKTNAVWSHCSPVCSLPVIVLPTMKKNLDLYPYPAASIQILYIETQHSHDSIMHHNTELTTFCSDEIMTFSKRTLYVFDRECEISFQCMPPWLLER